MRRGCSFVFALLGLGAFAGAALACGGGGGSTVTSAGLLPAGGRGGVYLALGDSIAAGSGASDASTTSYAALIAKALRGRYGDGLEVRSLAVGGATTQDLIDSQLDAALEALNKGDVRLVTITVSGNDLSSLQSSPDAAACIQNVTKPPCPVPQILVSTEQRLNTILRRLREAGPDTPMVIEVYPNFYSGTGHQYEHAAKQAFGLINDVILHVAKRHDILVADPRAAFEGRGGELTHILDPTPDTHPNDAGHRVIADAFLKVLGLSTSR